VTDLVSSPFRSPLQTTPEKRKGIFAARQSNWEPQERNTSTITMLGSKANWKNKPKRKE